MLTFHCPICREPADIIEIIRKPSGDDTTRVVITCDRPMCEGDVLFSNVEIARLLTEQECCDLLRRNEE